MVFITCCQSARVECAGEIPCWFLNAAISEIEFLYFFPFYIDIDQVVHCKVQ